MSVGKKSILALGLSISLIMGVTLYITNKSSFKEANILALDKGITECEGLYNIDTTHFGGQGNKFYPCLLAEVKLKRKVLNWRDKMKVITKHEKSHKILGFCHDLMHEVAIEYYDTIDASKKLPSLCGDGFLHGVMQTAAKKGDDKVLASAVEGSCKNTDGTYDGLCIHGIGHVYWEQLLDLKYFINKCVASVPGAEKEKNANILICEDGFLMKGSKLIKRYINHVVPGMQFGENTLNLSKEEANSLLEDCNTLENNLKYGCQAVFWRWYSAYFIYTKNTLDYKYLKGLCGEIVLDPLVSAFCARSIGTVVFNYMKYYDNFDAKYLYLLCTREMMPNCIDGVFEQYSEFPRLYDKNANKGMLNFFDYTENVCQDLSKDKDYGKEYYTDCEYVKSKRTELRVSG